MTKQLNAPSRVDFPILHALALGQTFDSCSITPNGAFLAGAIALAQFGRAIPQI